MEKDNKIVSELISIVKPVIFDAGVILKKRIKDKDEILYETDKDIKITSDILINDFIIEKLKKISGLPILSEEGSQINLINKKGNYWKVYHFVVYH
jgi:3'-phosphoadenosine 5'-phosphosulfate (PAPS) 3'-phosphatase